MGRKTVENLCTNLNLSNDMKDDALIRWGQTSLNKAFYNVSKQTKIILAATCVYITMMKFNNLIAITQICNAIGCDSSEFGKVYNQVIQLYPEYKPPNIQIEDLVPVVLSEAQVDHSQRIKLNERVVEIISLQKKLWLVEGRSPIHIIFAAAFLGWKSLSPYKRMKVRLKQFCDELKIEFKHTTSERVTELVNSMIFLAKRIPGKNNGILKISRQNIAIFVDEILKYQNALLYDLKQHDLINTFKKKSSQDIGKPKEEQASSSNNNNNNNKRNEFEDEIDDAEIDSYIRSDKEVKMIKKLKRLAKHQE